MPNSPAYRRRRNLIINYETEHLEEAVHAGRFRADLFYRLHVFPIEVPPLRARRSDIPQLVMFFLSRFSKKLGKQIDAVPQDLMSLLTAYTWPGNIRELENLIERAVLLSQGPVLRLDRSLLPAVAADAGALASAGMKGVAHTPDRDAGLRRPVLSPVSGEAPGAGLTLEAVEKRHILAVLTQTRWVIEGPKGAATLLNVHPNTLRSRMKKLGIKRPTHEIS